MTRKKNRWLPKYSIVGVVLVLGISAIAYSVANKAKTLQTAAKGAKAPPASATKKQDKDSPKPIPATDDGNPPVVQALRPPSDRQGAPPAGTLMSAMPGMAPQPPSSTPPVPADYSSAYGSRYGNPDSSNSAVPTDNDPPIDNTGYGAIATPAAAPANNRSAAPVAAALADTPLPVGPMDNSVPVDSTQSRGGPATLDSEPPIGQSTTATAGLSDPAPNSFAGADTAPSTAPPQPNTNPPFGAGAASIYGSPATSSIGTAASAAANAATSELAGSSSSPPGPPAMASPSLMTAGPNSLVPDTNASLSTPASADATESANGPLPTPAVAVPDEQSPYHNSAPGGASASTAIGAPPMPNPGLPATNAPLSSTSPSTTGTPDATMSTLSDAPLPSAAQPATPIMPDASAEAQPLAPTMGNSSPTGSSPMPSATASVPAVTNSSLPADVPGEHLLEGQQSPQLAIEKSAPQEIQVDRKAVFQITIRNNGSVPANGVNVVDRVPRGTQFVRATPATTPTADGTLHWQLGVLQPGQATTLMVELLPKMEGEIGSVAQVTFQANASVRSICTRPQLSVQQTAPAHVLIGQTAAVHITVTNTGTGAASNVVLEADVPDGFKHAAGRELEHAIGTLAPGASVQLALALQAVKPGSYQTKLLVHGEGNLRDEQQQPIEVTAPKLQLATQGPSHRFLDRPATYAVQIANPGSAAATNVQLVSYLPKGMKYVASDHQGQYDAQRHAVFWSLEELPAGEQGQVELTLLPLEAGELKMRVDGKADLGINQSVEQQILVEGMSELVFTVRDTADPIETGSQTTYEIEVRNLGSKSDANVQLVAQFPPGVQPVSGGGPTQATVQGQVVAFAPVASMAPDERVVFTIHARGQTVGMHVIRVQLRSNELEVPVTKEEGTRVYADQ